MCLLAIRREKQNQDAASFYLKTFHLSKKSISIFEEFATMKSFSSRLREIGLPLIQSISFTVQMLGNVSASDWAFDSSLQSSLLLRT